MRSVEVANQERSQPGILFSRWHSVRFAGFSVLGALSLVWRYCRYYTPLLQVRLVSIFSLGADFVRFCNSLSVRPQFRLPPWEHQVLTGKVDGNFSSTLQANETCLTQWPDLGDTLWGGSTCLAAKWSSLCGRNFVRYMSAFDDGTAGDNPSWMSERLEDRMPISAPLDNNVTVPTAWLDHHDVKAESEKAGRVGT